jgi:hypothetical protein
MKTFHGKQGPFSERPYFEGKEIDSTCIDELQKVGLYPEVPGPIRVDRFIEKRFEITPSYEDLGDGVLGVTKFGPKGVQEIVVARALDEEKSKAAERRVRATLAHEAGHGLFHAYLFLLASLDRPLFGDFSNPQAPKILCRDVLDGATRRPGYNGRWWEFQANQAIGGLLMPRPLVQKALEPLLIEVGLLGVKSLNTDNRQKAISLLADIFEVNPIVSKIRLEEVYPAESENSQLKL